MQVSEKSWFFRGRRMLPARDRNLLRAILGDGSIAREAYAEWRQDLDWSTIPAVSQRLLPILHHNATRLGIEDPLLRRIGGVRRYRWARNLRLMQLAKTVHIAFATAGIPVMALKGSALVAHRLIDRSIRPMEDLDILVRPDRIADAVDVLERLGMRAWPFRRDSLLRRLAPQAEVPGSAFRTANGEYVDLHWSAMHLDRRSDADVEMWQRSRSTDFEGACIRVPNSIDLVLQICGHGSQDGGAALLRAVVDTAIVVRGTAQFDWSMLLARAVQHRMSAVVSDALGILADAIGDENVAQDSRCPCQPSWIHRAGRGLGRTTQSWISSSGANRRAGHRIRLPTRASRTVLFTTAFGVTRLDARRHGHPV